MKDYKLKQRNLRASHTLGLSTTEKQKITFLFFLSQKSGQNAAP
jgi:hypothetical protein